MIEIHIYTVGKTKEQWVINTCKEYIKRLKPWARVVFNAVKDDTQLIQALEKVSRYIILDVKGKQMSSPEFAQCVENQGSRIIFVIGGPTGLPQKVMEGAALSISLSPMTFTHQVIRIILVEQLYRAYTIQKNIPYHK